MELTEKNISDEKKVLKEDLQEFGDKIAEMKKDYRKGENSYGHCVLLLLHLHKYQNDILVMIKNHFMAHCKIRNKND